MKRSPCLQHFFKKGPLLLGLFALSTCLTLMAVASESATLTATQELSRYWRTTYDILVRPSGFRSPIEEKYGLVEANYLSGINGGITITQYETIKAIPGVEVAAPIAMLGYVFQMARTERLSGFSEPGAYVLENLITVDNGMSVSQHSSSTFFYLAPENPPGGSTAFASQTGIIVNPLFPHLGVSGYVDFLLLMAGIDPAQESMLMKLDQALIEGEYLHNKPVISISAPNDISQVGSNTSRAFFSIPVLINATPYVSATLEARLKRLILPPETGLEQILDRGGREYLASQPGEVIDFQQLEAGTFYHRVLEDLKQGFSVENYALPAAVAALTYREHIPPFPHEIPVLEIVVPSSSTSGFHEEPSYRKCDFSVLEGGFALDVKGIFDITRIPPPPDVNRVPLETYFPPLVTLRYDEMGHPVEPRILRPTLNPCGYIQSPPLILTTLEAARALHGDDCISAIRVRVGGIDELTPQAQRKIEAVASEIHRRTGLDVDIMVGSSPRRILVHVPGIGYVEEQWVQKNVTLSYHRRIQSGHLLLIAALLVTGGLFVADMAWADLLARQPVLALQKALGWRSATLMGHVLRRALLVGAGAGLSGTALAAGALALVRQPLPSLPWLAGVPLLVTALSLLGSLYPALQAARVPPIPLLQMAGLRHRPGQERVRGRSGGVLLSARYALRGVVRRWSRSLLAGMTAALSAGLLMLLVGVVVDRAGYLSGTLLGEYILVQVEGYHWWLVGVGMALAAAGMGNSLLAGVLERRREIGVLKALGWRTGAVARLFLLEGAVLGLLGGLAGTALGLAVYLGLYRSVGIGLLWAVLAGLGVPTLVGALAAAYPARVAAAVAPAEAVRGE
jgi:hypothetical protein